MPDREDASLVFLHQPDSGETLQRLYRLLAQSGIAVGDMDINPAELAKELKRPA